MIDLLYYYAARQFALFVLLVFIASYGVFDSALIGFDACPLK